MTFGRNGPSVCSFVRSLPPISHVREELFKCGFLRRVGYISGTNCTQIQTNRTTFEFLHIYKKSYFISSCAGLSGKHVFSLADWCSKLDRPWSGAIKFLHSTGLSDGEILHCAYLIEWKLKTITSINHAPEC